MEQIVRLAGTGRVEPDQRRLAGVLSGVLCVIGGITLPLLALLPGVTHEHRGWVLAIAGLGLLLGLLSISAVNWRTAPAGLIHLSHTGALTLVALAVASTGGAHSPAWIYLFFAGMFAAYFYGQPIAIVFLVACVAVHALPLLYDSRATSSTFLAQFAIAGPAYLGLGGAIIAAKRHIWALRSRAERLVEQQGALRRVATAVVGGDEPERISELVATEAAGLLRVNAAGILRIDGPGRTVVTGSWSDYDGGRYPPGTEFPIKPGSDVERAINTGLPATTDRKTPTSALGRLGYRSSLVTPIRVADKVWGVIVAAGQQAPAFGSDDERRLMEFGALLATAIASIEDRAMLATQASSDPLTGLANQRALQQRLTAEAARAARHGRPLSVAVIDIDHFKQLNDSGGQEAGDETLVRVAHCLRALARAEDTLGRVGGDEFAWLLPDTTRQQALVALERARRGSSKTWPSRTGSPSRRASATPQSRRIPHSCSISRTARLLEQGSRAQPVLGLRPGDHRRALGTGACGAARALEGPSRPPSARPGDRRQEFSDEPALRARIGAGEQARPGRGVVAAASPPARRGRARPRCRQDRDR